MLIRIFRHRVAILFTLFSWAAFGVAANSSDIQNYGLYQIGAESIVQYHTYKLGFSLVPGWKDAGDGDIFYHGNAHFPAKQPGAFYVTAIPYFFLHNVFGMSFEQDQALVAALNAWLGSSLLAAISVGFLYELLSFMGFTPIIAGIASFAYAFGTNLFAYSGVPHHDVMAAALIVFTLYSLKRYERDPSRKGFLELSAFLMTFVLFFSMLPAFIVGGLAVYAATLPRFSENKYRFGFYLLLGYMPLAIFNLFYFGGPFEQANMAGNYQDTFFHFSMKHIAEHWHDYFGPTSYFSLVRMMPIFMIGVLGLAIHSLENLLPLRSVKTWNAFFRPNFALTALAIFVAHTIYLLDIQTIGHCQWGPRYYLPYLPLAMVGVAEFLSRKSKLTRKLAFAIVLPVTVYSVGVNSVGALGDSMYCRGLVDDPVVYYWQRMDTILNDHFYILPYSIAVFTIAIAFLIFCYVRRNSFPVDGLLPKRN